jgi:hypothetical protein
MGTQRQFQTLFHTPTLKKQNIHSLSLNHWRRPIRFWIFKKMKITQRWMGAQREREREREREGERERGRERERERGRERESREWFRREEEAHLPLHP